MLAPTLSGVISGDYLYYEGLKVPQSLFILRDGGIVGTQDVVILERYWNDMYNLFLRKLTQFAGMDPLNDEDTLKLQALLQELIKVKSLIENASKTAIMKK